MRYAEQEHFRANEVWSIEKVASKRGQRALVHYAEREQLKDAESGLIKKEASAWLSTRFFFLSTVGGWQLAISKE